MGFRPETFNNFPSCSRPCVDATNLFTPTATGLLYVRKWNHVARHRASTATTVPPPVRGPALLTEGAFRYHPVQFGCAGLIYLVTTLGEETLRVCDPTSWSFPERLRSLTYIPHTYTVTYLHSFRGSFCYRTDQIRWDHLVLWHSC